MCGTSKSIKHPRFYKKPVYKNNGAFKKFKNRLSENFSENQRSLVFFEGVKQEVQNYGQKWIKKLQEKSPLN